MKRKFLRSACGLLCSAAIVAFAAPAQAADPSAPAMWRLKDSNSEVYLFGTFHVLPPSIEWTTPAFDGAMKAAETTMTEADVTSPAAQAEIGALVQQYGLNPQGVTLSSVLGPERSAELAEIAGALGVPPAALEPYRPWLALISLAAVAMQQAGFQQGSGVETVVLAQAAAEKDAIAYLETASEQIQVLAGLDEEEMLANFDVSLDQFREFKALTTRMLEAWRTGDVADLEALLVEELRSTSPKAFDDLIVRRNRNWVVKIDEIMKGEGDYFIAVGAGHLVGEDSVVDLLQERGYKVERIQ